jgi:Tol biopolymer transport system component
MIKAADWWVQSVRPDWSPDGKRLVFGDDLYGLEVYDLQATTRTRLASVEHSGRFPIWSPSGKWIAAHTSINLFSSIVVLSDNGRFFTFGKKCDYVFAYEWSPVKDQLAFTCNGFPPDQDELWIWDFGAK